MAARAVPAELAVGGQAWVGYDVPLDERELVILETRDYLNRRYVGPGRPSEDSVDFSVVFSQDNRKGTHPPDVCLEGAGSDIIAKGDVTVRSADTGRSIPCRELVVGAGAFRLYVLYTYKCADTYTRSFWRQQFVIFLNGLLRRSASGALIRVSTPIADDLTAARRRARQFLSVAMPHLDRGLP